MSPTVPVQDLKVGMFVQLELGWISHPFPLSNFRIQSADQIETIRSLGLTRVRWVPEKSLLEAAPPLRPENAEAAGKPAAERSSESLRRAQLAAEREAAARCEQQHAEAVQAWRELNGQVVPAPREAGSAAGALAQALLDKMIGDRELCIRLLSVNAGDRASAHALNVAVISLLMGRAFGLPDEDMLALGVGALLHDVGKLDLPDRLRQPDEGFTSAETNAYREHVAAGVAHGRRMGLPGAALMVLAQHHEAADGSGFPLRMTVDKMTLAARIVAVVNRYDNLCNPAVLARALTPHEALSMLFAQSRSKFDATVLNAFIRMMGVYPAGSVVQLTDDRYAMVVGINSSRPLKPRVLVHDPKVARDEALLLDLEALPDLGIRRSLSPSKLPPAAMEYLAPRPRVTYFFEPGEPVVLGERAFA